MHGDAGDLGREKQPFASFDLEHPAGAAGGEADAERECHARGDEARPGLVEISLGVHPERNEQQSRLIDMSIISIDDGDAPVVGIECSAKLHGHHRSAGAAAENHYALHEPLPVERLSCAM